jgi:Na+-transporting NADH:ubiquinone oxidoreductase subunit B
LRPLVSALHDLLDLLYLPGEGAKGAPYIHDALNVKRIMLIMITALAPAVFMALYNTGLQANLALNAIHAQDAPGWRGGVLSHLGIGIDPRSVFADLAHGMLYFLPVFTLSLVVALFWEVLFAVVRRRSMDGMFIITALLFSLLMPPTISWWQAALGISFGLVMGRHVYGGTGRNILNPALVGYAFLFFAYPAQISGEAVWVAVDGVTRATPLAELSGPAADMTVSWMDAFLGFVPGAMGETSSLACLIGALVLIVSGIGSWRVMLGVLAGMTGLALAFNAVGSATNPLFQVTPLWHAVTGGFAFGTVFMATDPVTGAATNIGKILYGLLIGVLTVLIRVVNPAFSEGMMLAILFGNVFAPVIDTVVVHRHKKRRLMRDAR